MVWTDVSQAVALLVVLHWYVGVLHEGGVLLADIRVYSTKVRISCSMHNP